MSASISSMQTQAVATHQCSRDTNGDGEGGRSNYPSDPQQAAFIKKKYVAHSEDHDQMEEEASDSEAPRPISSRTRSRQVKKSKKRVTVYEDVDDEDPVSDDEGLDDDEVEISDEEGAAAK